MVNTSIIPAARVPVLDDKGLVTREWYRFFSGISSLTSSGFNDVSLLDLQVEPKSINEEFYSFSVKNTSDISNLTAIVDGLSGSTGNGLYELEPKAVNEDFYSFSNKTSLSITTINNNVTALTNTVNGLTNYNVRNYLINGAFDIWQRATTTTYTGASSSVYLADRWIFNFTSAGAGKYVLQRYDAKSDPSSGYSRYAITVALTSATAASFEQRIEDALTLQSKYVMASIYFAGACTFNIELTQNFGTGGSPSSPVVLTSATLTSPSSAWARYAVLFQLGTVTSKIFGTNGDSYLSFKVNILSGFTNTYWLSDCQLERSFAGATSPSTFSRRLIGEELLLCQRYYTEVSVTPTTLSTYAYTSLPTTMRAAPTLSVKAGSLNGATFGGAPYGFSSIRQQTASAGASDALISCDAEL